MSTLHDRLDDYQREASFDSEPLWLDFTPAERERAQEILRDLCRADGRVEELQR